MEAVPRITARNVLAWCATITAFFLIFRSGNAVKVPDVLLVLLGALAVLTPEARAFFRETWPQIWTYLKYFFLLLFFVAFAQIIGYASQEANPFNLDTGGYYGRTIFNAYAFLLMAFLVAFDGRLLRWMSAAIIISPAVMLPIYLRLSSDWYVSGSRLAGFLQNPIVLGSWMMVGFFIGLGFFLDAKRTRTKIAIVFWLVFIANFSLWSGTRAAWLGILAGLVFWIGLSCVKKNFRGAWSLALVSFFVFFLGHSMLAVVSRPNRPTQSFIAERAASLFARPLIEQAKKPDWQRGVTLATDNPSGMGFPTPSWKEPLPDTNTFLQIFLYGGIGALAAFLIILWKLGKGALRGTLRPINTSDNLSLAWRTITLSIIVTIFLNESLFFRLTWIALGIAAGAVWVNKHNLEKNRSSVGGGTSWIRALIPRFFREFIVQFRNHYTLRFRGIVFYGKFDSFGSVFKEFPREVTSYHSKASLHKEISDFQNLRKSIADARMGISPIPFDKTTLLTGLVSSYPKEKPTILDVGGGGGILLPYLIYSCPLKDPRLVVQELPEVVAAGKREFGDEAVEFVSESRQIKSQIDFVYFGSSLQYFEDYVSILRQVTSLKPEFVLIAQTPMTIHPSFVTAQVNLRKRIVPINVINKNELIEKMSQYGFTLVHQSESMSGAKFQNFPPGSFLLNFVFSRTRDHGSV